jgi:hypothetical protein
MIVWLRRTNTPYHYCSVGQDTVEAFKASPGKCAFFNYNIGSKPDGMHGPFDCRDHPIPSYPK